MFIGRLRIILLSLFVLCPWTLQAQDQISLIVPDFKPYTYLENGQFVGVGVEAVASIMAQLGVNVSLKLAPNYGRALAETKAGRADGFFMASQNAERDAVANFSEPLMYNNWSWFSLAKKNLEIGKLKQSNKALVGTIINTNTHKWLLREGYNVSVAAQDARELLMLLIAERCDVVFLAESAFISAASLTQDVPELNQVVEVKKPFGLYISREYVAKHPEFMGRLNAQILGAQSP